MNWSVCMFAAINTKILITSIVATDTVVILYICLVFFTFAFIAHALFLFRRLYSEKRMRNFVHNSLQRNFAFCTFFHKNSSHQPPVVMQKQKAIVRFYYG